MKIQMIADIRPSQNAETGVSLGYLFSPDAEVTIGREIGNTIAPLIDSLSRHHAKIYAKDGEWFVEDLGSTNGSFLNGAKLEAATKLATGSKLQFGTMMVSVELLQDAGYTAQIPAPAPAPAAMTPAEAAAAGAAAAQIASHPTIMTKPTIPGLREAAAEPGKPVLPTGVKPIEAPRPVVDDVPDLPPVEPEKLAAPAPAPAPAAPKPAAPALKPGLKLPPKPGLGAGIKLPPKPTIAGGLKLPPKPVIKKV